MGVRRPTDYELEFVSGHLRLRLAFRVIAIPVMRKVALPLIAQQLGCQSRSRQRVCLARILEVKDNHAGTMMRHNLEAAEILHVNTYGLFADFHSLRHTFMTNMINSGINPKLHSRWPGTRRSNSRGTFTRR